MFSIIRDIQVGLPQGLHTRPSGKLAQLISSHHVSCFLYYGEEKVNALSILDVVTLMIPQGANIRLEVSAQQEEIAQKFLDEVVIFFNHHEM
jgi:phosphotransferase system HPr (HPr) family protein